jgi:hypothetical protein
MSEDTPPRRTITPADIARLAELLDKFESADDPESELATTAESQYKLAVDELFAECVKSYYTTVTFAQFRGHMHWRCREYLSLQARRPPALPPPTD